MNTSTGNEGILMNGGKISAENIAVGKNARAIKNMNNTADNAAETSVTSGT